VALEKCSECGKEISSLAAACPSCGAPRTPAVTKRPRSRWVWWLIAIIGVAVVIELIGSAENGTDTAAKRPPLDYSRPIFTDDYALMCPIGAFYDLRADHGPAAIADLFMSVFGREEKEKRLGCQELRGGLRVYARRMKAPYDPYVQVSFTPDSLATVFTVEAYLKNGVSEVVGTQQGAASSAMPDHIGQCVDTTIKSIGTRLDGVPGSGSSVSFSNGGFQVSYQRVSAVEKSKAGDKVNVCLVSIPKNCPAGDSRGREYKATNLRSAESWTLPNSEHTCGGA